MKNREFDYSFRFYIYSINSVANVANDSFDVTDSIRAFLKDDDQIFIYLFLSLSPLVVFSVNILLQYISRQVSTVAVAAIFAFSFFSIDKVISTRLDRVSHSSGISSLASVL